MLPIFKRMGTFSCLLNDINQKLERIKGHPITLVNVYTKYVRPYYLKDDNYFSLSQTRYAIRFLKQINM